MAARRRKNIEISDIPPAAYVKRWYKVDGVKRKISVVQAAALKRKGRKVETTVAPVRRGPQKKKRKTTRRKSTARKTTRRKTTRRKSTARKTTRRKTTRRKSARRWYKVGVKKRQLTKKSAEGYRRRGYKVRLSTAPRR